MRPLLSMGVVIFILGGLQFYMQARQHFGQLPVQLIERPAPGKFDLEVTLSFDAGIGSADPFAVGTEKQDELVLLVTFRGKPLLQSREPLKAGQPLRIENIQGIVTGKSSLEGRNEIYLRIRPADLNAKHPRAAHVRILRDDLEVASQTLWSDPHKILQGSIIFEIYGHSSSGHHPSSSPTETP